MLAGLTALFGTPKVAGDQPSADTTPLTLNDWLRHKKQELRPEVRVQTFVTQADQLVDKESYEDAIHLYSKAIEVSPKLIHLYSNRAFCYEMIGNYELCLTDAQTAITLSDEMVAIKEKAMAVKAKMASQDTGNEAATAREPREPAKYRDKLMYWRKGRALRHLKRFQEAIDALVLSKSLAIRCQFVDKEIRDIKLEVIGGLGYDRPDVEAIADSMNSMDELIKQLNQNKRLLIITDNLNDDSAAKDQLPLPSNPFGYRGLYVNGLAANLEEERLQELLESCGHILRCKVYSNGQQSRAIIHFLEEQSTRSAIGLIRSNRHLIRGESLADLVVRYRKGLVIEETTSDDDPQRDFKGTVIGGECYKWRTVGCDDNECEGLHIPLCHHLDQQSIETEAVKRKRVPIVFSNSTTDAANTSSATVKSSERQLITFDLSDDESDGGNRSLTTSTPANGARRDRLLPLSRSGRKKSIRFDLDAPKEEDDIILPLSPIRIDPTSDRKVIRFNTSSKSCNNDKSMDTDSMTITTTSTPRSTSNRKRIVFDLPDDGMNGGVDGDEDKQLSFTRIKSRPNHHHTCTDGPLPIPKAGANDYRNVTAYDDLFD